MHDEVTRYLEDVRVAGLLAECARAGDAQLTCQKWLRSSAAKRLIFDRLYGDLLDSASALRVLDVGGGLTALTHTLASRHDYTLVDMMAHNTEFVAKSFAKPNGASFVHAIDWHEFRPTGRYDVVIANDLFPMSTSDLPSFSPNSCRYRRKSARLSRCTRNLAIT